MTGTSAQPVQNCSSFDSFSLSKETKHKFVTMSTVHTDTGTARVHTHAHHTHTHARARAHERTHRGTASTSAVTASTSGANIAYWSLVRDKSGPPTEVGGSVGSFSPPNPLCVCTCSSVCVCHVLKRVFT